MPYSDESSSISTARKSTDTDTGTSVNTVSSPSSAQSLRSRGSRPLLQPNQSPLHPSRPVSFITPVHEGLNWPRKPSFRDRVSLFFLQLLSVPISSVFLLIVVSWALLADLSRRLPKWLQPVEPASFPWDDRKKWENEKCVKDVRYYARAVGMDIVDEEVETDDGYYLRVHRVVNPKHKHNPDGKGGYPVLVLHGLFQSSGAFITSEERSLAFWLSEHGGYQIFLGNTRGVFQMGHREYGRSDPRFWDWTIRELAMYDLPALVEHVCSVTGYSKIAYIGHSQGNGIGFLMLSAGMRPDVGSKLSCFIALAPAVFAGPLTRGFPFSSLSQIEWKEWRVLFGVLDFIPLMRHAYDWCPPKLFAAVGYAMFSFLFSWTDVNWLRRRKIKIFRFTPTPVSSSSIFWWCGAGGFAQRKCIMDIAVTRWFDENFPPLAIYHGGCDLLVATEPLLSRIDTQEPHVKVIRVERLEKSEHCDFYLAAESVEWCFQSFIEDIEMTRIDKDI